MKKTLTVLLCFCIMIASQAQPLNAEQKTIQQTFFNFLKFYQKNEAKFNSFRLYKGTGEEGLPPYHILWKNVDKYFNYLRISVPYVGEAYIQAERNHFRYSDSCFKADTTEEMPIGFDYDRWGGGQESAEYMIQWYTSAKNQYQVIITGNKAELRIGSPILEDKLSWAVVPFVKEKGKWKMADNIYPFEDEERDDGKD